MILHQAGMGCAAADKPMNLNDHLKNLETTGIPEAQRWHSLAVILREFMEAEGVDLDYEPDKEEPAGSRSSLGLWLFVGGVGAVIGWFIGELTRLVR